MSIVLITGTGTEVGKTIVTAAIAALAGSAGHKVAVVKPAQTGVKPHEPGDVDTVAALAGGVTIRELRRYPDPLAPATAARHAGMAAITLNEITNTVTELSASHDLVLIEGAGGLLVRLNGNGTTVADVAAALSAQAILVASAQLGTLNTTALTAEALARREIPLRGVVIGRWTANPDLAMRYNVTDLPDVAGAPLLGIVPDGIADLAPASFRKTARASLAAALGGEFTLDEFMASQPEFSDNHRDIEVSIDRIR